MNIYKADTTLLISLNVDDNSFRQRNIMGEDNVILYFALSQHLDIPVGSYIEVDSTTYTVMRPEAIRMLHTHNYEYTVTFESAFYKAKMWKFRNPVDGRLRFPLTATPQEHLQMFVDNMNRHDTGWQIGLCIGGAEKLISYDQCYCLDALAMMAQAFDTEYEILGKVVSLRKIEFNKSAPLSLSYGQGNGFKSGIGRTNQGDIPPVEILFAQGGSNNIDKSTYGNATLLLPKNQSIGYDGTYFSDEQGYVQAQARQYVVDSTGSYVKRSDKALSSQCEDSLDCSQIYPKRVGTITQVVTVDATKHFYDIVDSSIPVSLDYNDYLIAGEKMTIIFQSGSLAGREFEVKYYHTQIVTLSGQTKLARRFEIVPAEMDGETMPAASAFLPHTGDQYAVFHCALPQAYIRDNTTKTGAEWDMLRQCVRYLYENEEVKYTFTGELDGIWARQNWNTIGGKIKLGGYVSFTDTGFQTTAVLLRITGIKDYINKPHAPELSLGNSLVSTGFKTYLGAIASTGIGYSNSFRQSIDYAGLRIADAEQETEDLKNDVNTGFNDNIFPVNAEIIKTMVGSAQTQIRFVRSFTDPTPISDSITFDDTTHSITIEAGYIRHMTMGIGLGYSRGQAEYMVWKMNGFSSGYLDRNKRFYIYAMVKPEASRVASTPGDYVASETEIAWDESATKIYILIGVLNKEVAGVRTFSRLYGFTEIQAGRMSPAQITSANNNVSIGLSDNTMSLGDRLIFNKTSNKELLVFANKLSLSTATFDRDHTADGNTTIFVSTAECNLKLPEAAMDGEIAIVRQEYDRNMHISTSADQKILVRGSYVTDITLSGYSTAILVYNSTLRAWTNIL